MQQLNFNANHLKQLTVAALLCIGANLPTIILCIWDMDHHAIGGSQSTHSIKLEGFISLMIGIYLLCHFDKNDLHDVRSAAFATALGTF